MKPAILILSGGMDSATLAYYMKAQGMNIVALTFDYGQRHRKEIDAARTIAANVNARHHIVDISSIKPLLSGSALTDTVDVPHGHYAEETMRLTVVPNRNAIMLSIAYAHGVSIDAEAVYYAAHAGDHFIYPDCRPDFVDKLAVALQSGNDTSLEIRAPFIHMSKGQIAALGFALHVPYGETWTCYEGGDEPCGLCGACRSRQEALAYAEAL